LFAAMTVETSWQWWLFAALALVYGLLVLVSVIVILRRSASRDEKQTGPDDLRFPGRVTGERPSERNPG
jgi:uncharacterized protein YpmS